MGTADQLFPSVTAALDDVHRIQTTEAQVLRAMSRAQQWVTLRYRLLRRPFVLPLRAGVPLYHREALAPASVSLLSGSLGGLPLSITPLSALRYRDPQWLQTSGLPTLLYCVRWSLWGVYPVPPVDMTGMVSCLVSARTLTTMTQILEVPDGYRNNIVQVTIGLLLLTRERAMQQGLARIQAGLEMTAGAVRRLQGLTV